MTKWLLCWACALSTLYGCGDEVIEPGATLRIDIALRRPSEPDPLPAVGPPVFGGYTLTVTSESPPQEHSVTLDGTAGETTAELTARLRPTDAAELEVVVVDAIEGGPISRAHSAPFAFADQSTIALEAFIGRVDTWSLLETATAWQRIGGATASLSNGDLVLVGGRYTNNYPAAALYRHTTGELVELGGAPEVRFATVVAFGDRVLVAGGISETGTVSDATWVLDAEASTFVPGPTVHPHYAGGGAWFADAGVVVLAGGQGITNEVATVTLLDVAGTEPTVLATDALATPRAWHSVTPLSNLAVPSVLVAGGLGGGAALASAELLEVSGEGALTIRTTGGLGAARVHHAAVPFVRSNGRVLIFGGSDGGTPLTDGAPEVFDPTLPPAGGFRTLALPADATVRGPRVAPAAAPLQDGSVIVIGGIELEPAATHTLLVTAEDERVVALAGARTPLTRAGGSATLLFDGSVLLVGGSTTEVPGPATADLLPAAAEIFVPLCATPGCR